MRKQGFQRRRPLRRDMVAGGAIGALLIGLAALSPPHQSANAQGRSDRMADVARVVSQGAAPASANPVVERVAPTPPAVTIAERNLDNRLRTIGSSFNGDVGIAVKDLQTGHISQFDGHSLFPQQSVSKFLVALTAYDKADQDTLDLGRQVTVRKSDLTLFNQPIAQLIKGGGFTTTLSDLIHRALTRSDNTANDFVLWKAGGPEAVRAFIAKNDISNIRFGPGERLMQSAIAGMSWKDSYSIGRAFYAARNAVPQSVRRAAFERYVSDPVDGAAPVALANVLGRLKTGDLLSPQSTKAMLASMSNTRTGPQRLKGGAGPGWSVAHKTGTGQVLGPVQSGYNDIGILTAPDGKAYSVAVMIRTTAAPNIERMRMMQSVSRAVVDYHSTMQSFDFARGRGGARSAAAAE